MQQGNLIGPVSYLDDVTLGDPVEMVASDTAEIVNSGSKIDLSLNAAKCYLIAHPDFVVNDTLLQLSEWVKSNTNTTLLGAPLSPGPDLDHAWDKRCKELARAVDRPGAIGSQDGLLLMHQRFLPQSLTIQAHY